MSSNNRRIDQQRAPVGVLVMAYGTPAGLELTSVMDGGQRRSYWRIYKIVIRQSVVFLL